MAVILLAEAAAFAVGGFIALLPSAVFFWRQKTITRLFVVGIFPGTYLGWQQARRKHLPGNAAFRWYIPPLFPVFCVMLMVVLGNFEDDNIYYLDGLFILAAVLYPCVSFCRSPYRSRWDAYLSIDAPAANGYSCL
jgi:hypothetical protein